MSRKRLFVLSVGLAATLIATSLAPVLASYPGARTAASRSASAPPTAAPTSSPRCRTAPAFEAAHPRRRKPPLRRLLRGRPDRSPTAPTSAESWEIWAMKQNGTKQPPGDPPRTASRPSPTSRPTDRRSRSSPIDAEAQRRDLRRQRVERRRSHPAHRPAPASAPSASTTSRSWSPNGTPDRLHPRASGSTPTATRSTSRSGSWTPTAANQHALTTDAPLKDQVPDWSPDGTKIAYAIRPQRIWVMNANGIQPAPATGMRPVRSDAVRDRRRLRTGLVAGRDEDRVPARSRRSASTAGRFRDERRRK